MVIDLSYIRNRKCHDILVPWPGLFCATWWKESVMLQILEDPEIRWTSDIYRIGMETVDNLINIQFPLFFDLLMSILTKNSVCLFVV